VRIRRADAGEAQAALEQGVPGGQHDPRRRGGRVGVHELDAVEGELLPSGVEARAIVEAELRQRVLAVLRPARVVEDHDLGALRADAGHELLPVGLLVGRHLPRRIEREGVHVAVVGRDLVADHGREVARQRELLLERPVVGLVVVVGRDGELDPLAGQRHEAFLHARVAVAAEGERVDVRVGRDPARGVDLVLERELDRRAAPESDLDLGVIDAPLHAARGPHLAAALGHLQRARAVGGVGDARAHGGLRPFRVVDVEQAPVAAGHGEARGDRLSTRALAHAHLDPTEPQHLAQTPLVQAHAADRHVVLGFVLGAHGQRVAAAHDQTVRHGVVGDPQLVVHLLQPRELLVAERERPLVVDVARGDLEQPLALVGLRVEVDLERRALGLGRRLRPVRRHVVAEVVHPGVEHARFPTPTERDAGERGDQEREQRQPPASRLRARHRRTLPRWRLTGPPASLPRCGASSR